MRHRAVLAAAILAALPVGWYFGSPWWTLWRMREAAGAGDVRLLAAYVDFDALRADAAAQAHAKLDPLLDRIRRGSASGRERFAAAARRTIDLSVKDVVSPTALRLWLTDLSLRRSDRARGSSYVPVIEHEGLDVFQVHDARHPDRPATAVFRRHGLGWKLAAVRFDGYLTGQ